MASAAHDTVRLHHNLYTEGAIRDAAETFDDFASFAIHQDGEHYVVDISDIVSDVSSYVVAEFCNFALANSITGGRA